MKRTLEVLFRHKLLLVAPLLAALIGTAGFVFLQPASYQSSATLWVNGGGVGTQSAAQAQADIANQFVKTNTFALAVADNSPLGAYLNAHPSAATSSIKTQIEGLVGIESSQQPSADAIRLYLAAHYTLTAAGPSELILTVTAPTPDVAKGTADALIAQLLTAEVATKTSANRTQLALDQSQLKDQSAKLSTDLDKVRAYLAAHPNLSAPAAATDPQLTVLQDQATEDDKIYSGLLAQIDSLQSQIALAEQPNLAPFRVVDSPATPSSQSVSKQLLIAVAAGLLAGFVAVAAMGALLVRLDTTIHNPDEVQRLLGLSVIGSTPLSEAA